MNESNLNQLFPQFDTELIDHLEKIGQVAEFAEGEMLMRSGQYFKNSLLILDGRVKLYREGDDGEEFFLYYLEKGNIRIVHDLCNEDQTSAIKAKTVTPVKALTIPIQYMDGLMKDHKNWYYFVLETYRSRFENFKSIDQVAFHSMDEKLESYLSRQFKVLGVDQISITHQEIADDLNSSREVISRLLKKLESQKKISISRNEIARLS